jgi:hypothetical protein
MRIAVMILLAATTPACGARGEQWQDEVQQLATELTPGVEQAVGLEFKYPPNVAVRTKDEVYDYLVHKLETELPPEELERLSLAYRLFGLIPDTLDLGKLFLDLYTEQIVGFYDPITDSLYVVAGAADLEVRLIVAHELVHALQAQYVPLDSILSAHGDNDRQVAAQAVMEGQGILASLTAMMPDRDFDKLPDFWQQYRKSVREQQELMPIFSSAPLILKETLIFPYLGGADFVRWFAREYPDTMPYGPRLPQSTEQILHPESYQEGDEPVELRFANADGLVYDDDLGQFETQVLVNQLTGSESTAAAAARGWGGDRYGVFTADGDHALVWWSVWDAPQDARRFTNVVEREWIKQTPTGRRRAVRTSELGNRAAVLLLDAPPGWERWEEPPRVSVSRER